MLIYLYLAMVKKKSEDILLLFSQRAILVLAVRLSKPWRGLRSRLGDKEWMKWMESPHKCGNMNEHVLITCTHVHVLPDMWQLGWRNGNWQGDKTSVSKDRKRNRKHCMFVTLCSFHSAYKVWFFSTDLLPFLFYMGITSQALTK